MNLKFKHFLFPILTILFSQCLHAQQGFRFSFHTSFNATWLNNNNLKNDKNTSYKISFGKSYGGGVSYYLSEKIGFSFESYYDQYKHNLTGTTDNIDWESKTTLNYFSPALLLRVYTLLGIYFELGPQMNLLVSSQYEYDSGQDTAVFIYTGIPQNNDDINNVSKNFKGSSFSMIYGAGFSINMIKRLVICAGIRYNNGLTDIISDFGKDESTNSTGSETKSKAIGAVVGLQFKL